MMKRLLALFLPLMMLASPVWAQTTINARQVTYGVDRLDLALDAMSLTLSHAADTTTAVTFTGGDVTISGGAVDRNLIIDANAGQFRYVRYRSAGVARWRAGVTNTAEAGANAGSNYQIEAFSDAGVSLGAAFGITRSSRVVTFPVAPIFSDASGTRSAIGVSYGTAAGTVAQGNDSRITGAAQKASNLSDISSVDVGRQNIKAQYAKVSTVTGTDATASYNINNIGSVFFFSTVLTANRIANLTATAAYDGNKVRVVFTGGSGGFTLNVRDSSVTTNSKILSNNQWVDFTWDGTLSQWRETAFGSL